MIHQFGLFFETPIPATQNKPQTHQNKEMQNPNIPKLSV